VERLLEDGVDLYGLVGIWCRYEWRVEGYVESHGCCRNCGQDPSEGGGRQAYDQRDQGPVGCVEFDDD
jgi:hypothetical protein